MGKILKRTRAHVMKLVCQVCGYVHEGESAPDKCAQCQAPAEKFTAQGGDRE